MDMRKTILRVVVKQVVTPTQFTTWPPVEDERSSKDILSLCNTRLSHLLLGYDY